MNLFEAWALIWIFAQQIYYLPISWIGEPFFAKTEIGPHVQPVGIVSGVVIYGVVMLLMWGIVRKKSPDNNQV